MMSYEGKIVPGTGNPRARWMIVGEAPGFDEARDGIPFVGKTGQEQDKHLARNGLSRKTGWLTNLVKVYHEGNPEPNPEDVDQWGPELVREIRKIKPRIVYTAGSHATKFLVSDAELDAVHGMPQRTTIPDLQDLDMVVIPGYHPAAPFYAPDLLQFVVYDYARLAAAIKGTMSLEPAIDKFEGKERYADYDALTRPQFDEFLDSFSLGAVSIDTEGVPGDEWSLQLSTTPGASVVIRRASSKFEYARRSIIRAIRRYRPVLVFHHALYDIEMLESMGFPILDLIASGHTRLFDSMVAAYLMCIEPQGLKALARRWLGMKMADYDEVVGDVGREKQLAYLTEVMTRDWPAVEDRVEYENDGTARVYRPKHISKIAEAILCDVYSGKVTKEGLTDPRKRWRKADPVQRKMVEKVLGRMPVGTLADIPLPRALWYAGRDSDATIRLYPEMRQALIDQNLHNLMDLKMRMLPAAVEISMTGFLGERARFETLSNQLFEKKNELAQEISHLYFDDRPFNPNSPDQVATLLRRQGVRGEKRTPSGKMSTSKKSIEHLRFDNHAVDLVEQWREAEKLKSSFADPVLENWPEDQPFARVKVDLKITRVTSGRFSGSIIPDAVSAPLLAIPVRSEGGKEVRNCYVAEPGYVLGSWDLDQAEMRIMADESGDPTLVKLFQEGKRDVHSDTAAKIFGYRYEDIENDKALRKKVRDPAKRAGFGVITGIQGAGLFDQLRMAGAEGWSVDKCEELIREWFRIYPGVREFLQWCKDECRKNGGIAYDRWGMPRYLPAVFSDDKPLRWEAERQTHSHRIQGGAQGMLQRSMGWVYPRLKAYGSAVRFILQIHDELILEIADGLQDEVDPLMVEAMTQHGARLKIPVKSSGSFGNRWGELK